MYSTPAELGQQYQALSRRIEALDNDIGLETDSERRATMRARRAELAQEREQVAAALHRNQAGEMSNGSAADYRLSNAETVLRAVDGKMDRMSEQISDLSARQRLVEDRVQRLSEEVHQLANQMDAMRSPAGYSRVYLATGALAMTVVIFLLLVVTWRLL